MKSVPCTRRLSSLPAANSPPASQRPATVETIFFSFIFSNDMTCLTSGLGVELPNSLFDLYLRDEYWRAVSYSFLFLKCERKQESWCCIVSNFALVAVTYFNEKKLCRKSEGRTENLFVYDFSCYALSPIKRLGLLHHCVSICTFVLSSFLESMNVIQGE